MQRFLLCSIFEVVLNKRNKNYISCVLFLIMCVTVSIMFSIYNVCLFNDLFQHEFCTKTQFLLTLSVPVAILHYTMSLNCD